MVLAGQKTSFTHLGYPRIYLEIKESFLIFLPKSKGCVLSKAGNKTQFRTCITSS